MKKNNRIKFLLLSILFICFGIQLSAQEKVDLSLGLGLPELLNVGLRYQIEQVQVGVSFGTMPLSNESVYSISGDIYYHFAGKSELSNRRLWYGRVGLNYLHDETSTFIEKFTYFNLRIGRDFNLSRNFGFEIDAGAMFQLSKEKIFKVPPGYWNFNFNYPVLPSIGIAMFYRL